MCGWWHIGGAVESWRREQVTKAAAAFVAGVKPDTLYRLRLEWAELVETGIPDEPLAPRRSSKARLTYTIGDALRAAQQQQ